MQSFDVSAESSAPPEVVWELLLDPATWPVWSPVLDHLERSRSDGLDPEGVDGVGAVRAFRTGRAITRVRITALQAPSTLRYEGVENPAMTDYTAIVELTPTATGGTHVSWRGRYLARRGLRPRWYIARRVERFMQAMADGLAAHAQTRAG